ncbi:MAG: hypothetical protein JNL96_22815 [Planctomycetaceae bacterium]|nr:hypothetical protein [Planctomycetaceae bacterium]
MLRLASTPLLIALLCFPALTRGAEPTPSEVPCPGRYKQHLQGVCRDDDGNLYWCFTSALVKTDAAGKKLVEIPVGSHHGDLCHHDGRIYVAVNFGKFNRPAGEADSWVYVYEASDLKFVAKHAVPELVHGAGGMEYRDGRFYIVGGLPPGIDENYVYEYDAALKFVRRHILAGGYTLMGIQTAKFADGRWWFGCYGKPAILITAAADFSDVRRFEQDASLGLVPLGEGKFLIARGSKNAEGHGAKLVPATGDKVRGLQPTLLPPGD